MKLLLVLVFVAAALAAPRQKGFFEPVDYEGFKWQYAKTYGADEEGTRFEMYRKAINYINKHNAEYDEGKWTFWCGVNEHIDMTPEEQKMRNGFMDSEEPWTGITRNGSPDTAPDAIDWREKGAVQKVQDQGHCGSCWAFGSMVSLEGQWAINKGNLPNIAEQQLVSCDSVSHGCGGGFFPKTYNYIAANGENGIDTEESYPYTASESACDTAKTTDNMNVAATCVNHTMVVDEAALKEAVGNVGPISAAVMAAGPSFTYYSGGILNDPGCINWLDHAVAVVGYGVENDVEYWIVKNSWGETWGEEGYIRLITDHNMCGIGERLYYPNLE